MLMTDVDYPRFEVIMGGNDAYRDAMIVDADEFIGVKSYKAKGKRLTTFEVETINEIEPIRFAAVKEENTEEIDGGEIGENPDEVDNIEVDETVSEARVAESTEVSEKTEDSEEQEPSVVEQKIAKPEKPKKEKTGKATPAESVLPEVPIEDVMEIVPEPTETKAEEPVEKPVKPKKEKIIKNIPNDSVLPDDIVDNGRNNDDNGQLTLF